MTTLAFPSATFPGRPALALDVPEGWQSVPAAGEGADVVLAALRPLPEDVFKPTIVVTLDELFPEHSVRHDLDGVATTAVRRRDGPVGEVYTRTIGNDCDGNDCDGNDSDGNDRDANTGNDEAVA